MNTKTKFIIITLVLAIPAFMLGRLIWPPTPEITPTAAQIPLFMILSALESLAFGSGIAFLFLGWSRFKKLAQGADTLTRLAFLSTAWYLINWWPHDNIHAHNGMNTSGLLKIDYGFHVTMIAAGGILAYFFFTRILRPNLN